MKRQNLSKQAFLQAAVAISFVGTSGQAVALDIPTQASNGQSASSQFQNYSVYGQMSALSDGVTQAQKSSKKGSKKGACSKKGTTCSSTSTGGTTTGGSSKKGSKKGGCSKKGTVCGSTTTTTSGGSTSSGGSTTTTSTGSSTTTGGSTTGGSTTGGSTTGGSTTGGSTTGGSTTSGDGTPVPAPAGFLLFGLGAAGALGGRHLAKKLKDKKADTGE